MASLYFQKVLTKSLIVAECWYTPGPLTYRFDGCEKWLKISKAPTRPLKHQLVLLNLLKEEEEKGIDPVSH